MKPSNYVTERRMLTGLRIRRERLLWGMTQEELSSALGISSNYLSQIERGNRDLSRNIEDRLCDLFRLDHNELHSVNEISRSDRLAESNMFMPHLQSEEIQRLLDSCSPEELQLCGQMLRSMLLFLRHPDPRSAV